MKSKVKKTKEVKVDLKAELGKLLEQKQSILIKIDELNNRISDEAYDSACEKLKNFIKTLNEEELNQVFGTGLIDDIITDIKNPNLFKD